ncbi:MAG: PH domain-containing protein [Nocardioides sp.]
MSSQPTPEPGNEGWLRLDPRMLLIHPIQAIKDLIFPLVAGTIGLSATTDNNPAVAVISGGFALMLYGAAQWASTRYRITSTQVQVRTGLLNRKLLTAHLDRVRTVDLTANILHRLLGLQKVEIGTGVDITRIELNALRTGRAVDLASALRERSAAARRSDTQPASHALDEADGQVESDRGMPEPSPQVTLAEFDQAWLRFAPLSLSRLAVLAGAVGILTQFIDSSLIVDLIEAGLNRVAAVGLLVGVSVLVIGGAIGLLLLSVVSYIAGWGNLRLTADHETVQLRAGMITTRTITLEQAKIRGVRQTEPVLLRLAHGAELAALATGVGAGGMTQLLPPAPLQVVTSVGTELLRRSAPGAGPGMDSGAAVDVGNPLSTPLIPHGPAARRRCHVRAQIRGLFWLLMLAAATWRFELAYPRVGALAVLVLLTAAASGELGYRNLGHALTPHHIVSGDGLLTRTRTVLERDGILGWAMRQTLFQRRAGLVDLIATTAAGSERVRMHDIPRPLALAFADQATPRMMTVFLTPSTAPSVRP